MGNYYHYKVNYPECKELIEKISRYGLDIGLDMHQKIYIVDENFVVNKIKQFLGPEKFFMICCYNSVSTSLLLELLSCVWYYEVFFTHGFFDDNRGFMVDADLSISIKESKNIRHKVSDTELLARPKVNTG